MKELILFLVSILFIACQNDLDAKLISPKIHQEPAPVTTTLSSVSSSFHEVLRSELTETSVWNLEEELKHPELPGIHYRPVVRSSESASKGLYCVSRISSDSEETLNMEIIGMAQNSGPAKLLSLRQ